MYAIKKLSGTTNGAPLAVGSGLTTIHTCVAQNLDGVYDQMFVFAANVDSVPHQLSVTLAGVDVMIAYPILANSSLILVVPGLIGNNGIILKMLADSANDIYVSGYVFNVGY